MKQGSLENFAYYINKMNEDREKHYSVSKMKEKLGDEPWDTDFVLFLYMKNFDAMQKLLSKHKGHIAYSHIKKLNSLLTKLNKCYKQIVTDVENCERDYFSIGSKGNYDVLNKAQDSVNLFFYAYVSLCYSLVEVENRLQAKFIINKTSVTKAFEEQLQSDVHSCIMFIRNKMNHGLAVEFHWQTHIDYLNQTRAIKFGLRKDNLQALETHINGEKDRKSYKFLESINAEMLLLLNEHFPKMEHFIHSICDIIHDENKTDILLCNSYYEAIHRQMDAQSNALVKQITSESSALKSTVNELWALERSVI